MTMTIGAAAARSRCAPSTIRYYEAIGLLRPVVRSDNGRRAYRWPDISRLQFIKRCRDFGFAVEQIRRLLEVTDARDPSCLSARDLVVAHVEAIRAKRVELEALEATLRAMASSCTAACAPGPTSDCRILQDLSGTPA